MIKKLRKKFVIVTMLFVFFILAIVFIAICVFTSERLKQSSTATLKQVVESPATGIMFRMGDSPVSGVSLDPTFAVRIISDSQIEITSSRGIEVSEDQAVEVTNIVLKSGQTSGIIKEYNLRYAMNSERKIIGFIDMTNENQVLVNTVITSLIVCFAGFVAFLILSIFLSKWVMRPVEKTWNQQKQFLSDASHELKTPLTVILANMRILKEKPTKSINEQIEWVENTETEATRMKGLVNSLLYLSKSDTVSSSELKSELDFSRLIFQSALSLEALAYEKGISFDLDIEENVKIIGDMSQLEQLIGILLDNAIKYSPSKHKVVITLKEKHQNAVLTVNNQGEVISEDNIVRLFDRFYRIDQSRATEGYGLGLAIAKRITEEHKGKISAVSNAGSGTTFSVSLPIKNNSSIKR